MSVTKKIIDLAKANLNSLLEKAAETVDPRRRLANIPDDELEAELARRKSARLQDEKVADAKARINEKADDKGASAGPRPAGDREAREKAARDREARVKAARDAREKAERAARAAEAGRASQAGSGRASTGSAGNSGQRRASGGSAGAGTGVPRGRNPDIARYYERLEVAYGSDWETVRASYRKLMRKYHPDMHAGKSPEKQKAAHEVAQALTQAYNELEKHLMGGPNRRG